MAMRTVEPEELDLVAHQAEYAKAGGAVEDPDHLGALRKIHERMILKRRNLAQDAMLYDVGLSGRAIDIARVQPIIEALERAIADEERRAPEAARK